MRHDDQIVDRVQSLNDIVEVISASVPLKRSGKSFKALCPFHQEKTPSFIVNPEKQIFHCFGCGAGGDVFSFLMKHENLNFPEALRQLAERVHVSLPEPSRERVRDSISGKLFEICEAAFQYYRGNLEDREAGRPAREYLENRGFSVKDLAEFGVGYAHPDWRGLFEHLAKKGFKEEHCLRSGLILRSSQGHCYDFLRSRVIFPIRNVQGKVVAFGGRVLTDELPKYINSPETEIFQKRKEFYGLHLAKRFIAAEYPRLYVVEGYLDQIRLYLGGFKNVVATLGTSLTEEHMRILKRYVTEVVLVYDGDKAGESASLRGLEILLRGGLSVKLLSLPDGMDPDQLLKEYGPEGFERLSKNEQDIFDFKLASLLKRYDKNDSLGLLKITSEFLETFAHIPNAVLLDRYVNRLSVILGVQEDSIRRELGKLKKKFEEPGLQENHSSQGESEGGFQVSAAEQSEFTLLSVLLSDPSLLEKVVGELTPEEFDHHGAREIYRILLSLYQDGERISLSSLFNRIRDEELKTLVSKFSFFDLDVESRIKAVSDCLRRIKQKNYKKDLMDLQLRIKQAESTGHEDEVLRYLREYQTLMERSR